MTDYTLEQWEHRLLHACAEMVDALPADTRAEFETLRNLEPEAGTFHGLRIRHIDDEFIEVSWLGRALGAIRRSWLFEEESP
jgi:hypothetical protein